MIEGCFFVKWYLRSKLDFKLAAKVLTLKLLVFADVRRDHPLDLLRLQQEAEAKVVHASIVAHNGQAFDFALEQASNKVFRDSTETKS